MPRFPFAMLRALAHRNDPPLCHCEERDSSLTTLRNRLRNLGGASLLSLRGARFLAYASEQAPQSRWGFPSVVARHDSAEAISGTIGVVSKQYYVYMMTNNRNTVLYVGVTNDLIRRVYEHKEKVADGFTRKYNITKLVYYEVFEDIENAILREKQIKAGSRQKKVQLINSLNGEWHEL